MRSSDWVQLGGYDETFAPKTWQDVDLLFRARAIGAEYIPFKHSSPIAIRSSWENRVGNLDLGSEIPKDDPSMVLATLNALNMSISLQRPIKLPYSEQRAFRGLLNGRLEIAI